MATILPSALISIQSHGSALSEETNSLMVDSPMGQSRKRPDRQRASLLMSPSSPLGDPAMNWLCSRLRSPRPVRSAHQAAGSPGCPRGLVPGRIVVACPTMRFAQSTWYRSRAVSRRACRPSPQPGRAGRFSLTDHFLPGCREPSQAIPSALLTSCRNIACTAPGRGAPGGSS